jgi:type III secretion protein L
MKLFSLIKQGDVHLSLKGKILPKEELGELLNAKEIIERAETDAEEYSQENVDRCQKEREKAHEEGYQAGLTELNRHILALDNKIKELHHEMNKLILPLALKAAKKILGRELESHPEAIVDVVLQTLRPVREAHRVKIYVSKEDREHVEAKKPGIREKLEQVQNLSIEERADLKQGDCIIETESGIINATLENQWRALEAAFETYLKQST